MVKKKNKDKKGVDKKKIWIAIPAIILMVTASFFLWLTFSGNKTDNSNVDEHRVNECIERLNEQGGIHKFVAAVNEKNISICSGIDEESLCLNDYYFFTSIIDNVNNCEKINDPSYKSFCNMVYNSESTCPPMEKDPDIICEVFLGASARKCKDIEDPFMRNECQNFPILIHAVKEEDINRCKEIKDMDRKRTCMSLLGHEFSEDEMREICIKQSKEWLQNREQQATSNS